MQQWAGIEVPAVCSRVLHIFLFFGISGPDCQKLECKSSKSTAPHGFLHQLPAHKPWQLDMPAFSGSLIGDLSDLPIPPSDLHFPSAPHTGGSASLVERWLMQHNDIGKIT